MTFTTQWTITTGATYGTATDILFTAQRQRKMCSPIPAGLDQFDELVASGWEAINNSSNAKHGRGMRLDGFGTRDSLCNVK